jgi:hypothetical protein
MYRYVPPFIILIPQYMSVFAAQGMNRATSARNCSYGITA